MKKYKRTFGVLLSATMCFGLVACGDAGVQADSASKTVSESSSVIEETVIPEEPALPEETVLTKDELNSYLKEVEITTENWEDYFSVEDYNYVEKDDFGEATGNERDEKVLVCRENVIPVVNNSEDELVFEFSYTSTVTECKLYDKDTGDNVSDTSPVYVNSVIGYTNDKTIQINSCSISSVPADNSERVSEMLYETRIQYNSSGTGDESVNEVQIYDISDFALNRVKGSVKVLNIPDEKWNTDEEHGKYIVVNPENGSAFNYYMFENGAVFENDSFDNIDWESGNIGGDEGLVSWQNTLELM